MFFFLFGTFSNFWYSNRNSLPGGACVTVGLGFGVYRGPLHVEQVMTLERIPALWRSKAAWMKESVTEP